MPPAVYFHYFSISFNDCTFTAILFLLSHIRKGAVRSARIIEINEEIDLSGMNGNPLEYQENIIDLTESADDVEPARIALVDAGDDTDHVEALLTASMANARLSGGNSRHHISTQTCLYLFTRAQKEIKELPSALPSHSPSEKERPLNNRRRAFEVDISAVPIQRIVQPVHHVLKRPESPSLSVHQAVFGKIERINHENNITVTTAIDYIRKKMSSDEVPKSTFEHVYPKGTIVVNVSNHPHHVVRAAAISRYTLRKSYITFEDQPHRQRIKDFIKICHSYDYGSNFILSVCCEIGKLPERLDLG
jgi:hypothetical protein